MEFLFVKAKLFVNKVRQPTCESYLATVTAKFFPELPSKAVLPSQSGPKIMMCMEAQCSGIKWRAKSSNQRTNKMLDGSGCSEFLFANLPYRDNVGGHQTYTKNYAEITLRI